MPDVVRRKPLQAAKFVGILLALLLGVAGFLRVVDARAIVDHPVLGDGQFLAFLLVPTIGVGLVFLVFAETLVSGYRVVRSGRSVTEQLSGRTGYALLRCAEAVVALVGVTLVFAALPVLFAESTSAPAGVGIMLLLLVVGFVILFASFVRSLAELTVYA